MVLCNHCGEAAKLTTGRVVYPHRPDLATRRFWHCEPCEAWVGCHPGSNKALGSPANASLRQARSAAHAAFDPLWKSRKMSRSAAYAWLGRELKLPAAECHIGMFDEAQCSQVVQLLTADEFEDVS